MTGTCGGTGRTTLAGAVLPGGWAEGVLLCVAPWMVGGLGNGNGSRGGAAPPGGKPAVAGSEVAPAGVFDP